MVGFWVGDFEGDLVSSGWVGDKVTGVLDGSEVEVIVGSEDGTLVGLRVTFWLGECVSPGRMGDMVMISSVGSTVGCLVGLKLSSAVGTNVVSGILLDTRGVPTSNAGSGVGYPSGMLHGKTTGFACGGRIAGSGVGSNF